MGRCRFLREHGSPLDVIPRRDRPRRRTGQWLSSDRWSSSCGPQGGHGEWKLQFTVPVSFQELDDGLPIEPGERAMMLLRELQEFLILLLGKAVRNSWFRSHHTLLWYDPNRCMLQHCEQIVADCEIEREAVVAQASLRGRRTHLSSPGWANRWTRRGPYASYFRINNMLRVQVSPARGMRVDHIALDYRFGQFLFHPQDVRKRNQETAAV